MAAINSLIIIDPLRWLMALRTLVVGFAAVLTLVSPGYAQETTQAVDPRIAAALKEVSPARIQANIEKLVSFGTRATLSAPDPASIAAGRGIGAAREWIKSQFGAIRRNVAVAWK